MLESWEKIALRFFISPRVLWITLIAAIVFGLYFAYPGVNSWDDLVQVGHTHWMLYHYGHLAPNEYVLPYDQLYGPLWSLILGILYLPFRWINDETWLRHAFTFALYPTGLLLSLRLLLRAGVALSTAILAIALVIGIVRLGGHALINVKDFPHAMAFLVVSLYLFVRLQEQLSVNPKVFSPAQIFGLSLIALVPFLLRTPLLFHFLGLWSFFLLFLTFAKHQFSSKQILQMLGLPWLALVAAAIALFPVIWQAGPKPWVHMFVFFNQVYTNGSVRLFGVDYPSQNLPRWYSFVWIPIISNPAALVAAALGLLSLPWQSLSAKQIEIKSHLGPFAITLKIWLALILLGAWSTLVLKAPRLYDEERHILFIYPMLFLLSGLGLHWLPKIQKYALALIIVAWSLGTFMHWGAYSYIYKSPLLGKRSADAFMGDYWGVCLNSLVPQLPHILPDLQHEIAVPMAMGVAKQQRDRLGLTSLNLVDNPSEDSFYYVLVQRQADLKLKELEGKAKLTEIFRLPMPPNGDAACIVYRGQKI